MKNIKNKLALIATIMLLSLASCDKDPIVQDEDLPIVTIISPSLTDSYMSGDTVHIMAEISDNDELHEITGVLTRTHNGQTEVVWTLDTHSHMDAFTIDDSYIVEVPGMHNDFELKISGSDHNGNVGSETISFHVHM